MHVNEIRKKGFKGCEKVSAVVVAVALLALTACEGGSDNATLNLENLQEIEPSFGAATDTDINAAIDTADVLAGNIANIGILSNDIIPEGAKIQLEGQPKNGTAILLNNGEIQYEANRDYEGTDSVSYMLVAADGTRSTSTLYISVACPNCQQ